MKATRNVLSSSALALFIAVTLAMTGCSAGTLTSPEMPADTEQIEASSLEADRNEANGGNSTTHSGGRNEVGDD